MVHSQEQIVGDSELCLWRSKESQIIENGLFSFSYVSTKGLRAGG